MGHGSGSLNGSTDDLGPPIATDSHLSSRLAVQLQAAASVVQLQEDIPDSVPIEDLKKWWLFAVAVEDLKRHAQKAKDQVGSTPKPWFSCSCRSSDGPALDSVEYLERWQERWNPMIEALQVQLEELEDHGHEKEEIAQTMERLSILEVIALMKESALNEKVQANGCLRLSLWARDKVDRDQVLAGGGIEQVLEAMRICPASLHTQKHGTSFMATVSIHSGEIHNKLVSLGAIKVLIDAMQRFPKSQRVQENCVQTLAQICRRSNESKIVTLGGIEALLAAMRKHPTAEKLQRYGCAALGNLASSSKAAKDVFAQGGMQVVVGSMSSHRKSAKLQSKGCYAISIFASSSDARHRVDRLHGVEAVLEAMEEHADDPKVQEHGCSAVSALAQSSSIKTKIISLGGVRLVNNAFQNHIRVKAMQTIGTQARKALSV